MPDDLAADAFGFILVFARLGAAGMLLPGLGEQDVPASIRLALALCLPVLLMPVLGPGLPGMPDSVPGLFRLLGTEVLVGLWLGFGARLVALALAGAGQIGALMIGLASPLQVDPALGTQSTAPTRLFGLLAAVLLLSTGLYALPLQALARSYTALPPGATLPLDAAAAWLTGAVADSFALALQLAAPLLLAAVLSNLALALLARLVPQVPAYTIASPGQVLLGLLLLALVLPAMLPTWLAAAAASLAQLPGAD